MPSGDYALIKQLRLVAARQGRNTNKSEVVRAGLRSLLAVKPSDLVALLDGLEKVKPGRK
jgi:Arc/MetJ-type ribon-helix-helix transcriptional regulator